MKLVSITVRLTLWTKIVFSLILISSVDTRHFNGGTITWAPVNPNTTQSSVVITITQTYSWTMPNVRCANSVPISTSGREDQNDNLTCIVDCSTDGGYSAKPIDILTDCISSSSSLNMMTSQKSKNVTLAANASFSVAFQGGDWRSIGSPERSGLDWSIVASINLRRRPDGLINTPPVATIASPQYVRPYENVQIKIPVSDANAGDDVRCRWSRYQQGYKRRRREEKQQSIQRNKMKQSIFEYLISPIVARFRDKRDGHTRDCTHSKCSTYCSERCRCNCTPCINTNCASSGYRCEQNDGCPSLSSVSTTIETPATKRSTSSFASRQAVDECAGICYPNSVPSGTKLAGCTLNFTGLVPNSWYAVALQVEDFIDSVSNRSMSSVPVQFLIHVLPIPQCPTPPVLFITSSCLEAQVGIPLTFTIVALNKCHPDKSTIADIIVSVNMPGVQSGRMIEASNELSASINYTWTPQPNQLGSQLFCTTAFTSEFVQSEDYCITFQVLSRPACTTTTTSTTTATSSTSTTSTSTTSTTSTTTTSTTSTTSTSTTTTTTTTTSTTSTTSTTTTTTSTTTSTTSTTTTTTTSTTSTTSTSTTSTSTTTTTATTTQRPKREVHWLLILGLSLLAFLLALCCICCWLRYYLLHASKRKQSTTKKDEKNLRLFEWSKIRSSDVSPSIASMDTTNTSIDIDDKVLNASASTVNVVRVNCDDKPVKTGNPTIKSMKERGTRGKNESINRHTLSGVRIAKLSRDDIDKKINSSTTETISSRAKHQ